MADIQRTVEAKLKVTQEGEGEAFSELAADVKELESVSAETAEVLPDITSALEDVTEAQGRASEATQGHIKAVHSLEGLLKQVGGSTGDYALKVLAVGSALQVAKKAQDEAIDALNGLNKALGGSGEAFDTLGGIIPYPKEGVEKFAQALIDTKGYIEEYNGALDESIQKHKEVREAYLAAKGALDEKTESAKKAAEEDAKAAEAAEKAAAAAEKANQKQEEAANAAAAAADKAAEAAVARMQKVAEAAEALRKAEFGDWLAKEFAKVTAAANEAAAAADKVLAAASGKDAFGNPTQFGYGAPGGSEGVPIEYTFPGAPGSSSAGGGMG